jgi:hypothetical protein
MSNLQGARALNQTSITRTERERFGAFWAELATLPRGCGEATDSS